MKRTVTFHVNEPAPVFGVHANDSHKYYKEINYVRQKEAKGMAL